MADEQIKDYLLKYKITSEEGLAQHIEELKRCTVPNNELIFPLVEMLVNRKDCLLAFFRENSVQRMWDACEISESTLRIDPTKFLLISLPERSINEHLADVCLFGSRAETETPLKFTILEQETITEKEQESLSRQHIGHSTRHKAHNMGHRLIEEEEERVFKNWNTNSTYDRTLINSLGETNKNTAINQRDLPKQRGEDEKKSAQIQRTMESIGKKESDGKLHYEISWRFIEAMAQRMANNKSDKYPRYNWRKKIEIQDLKDAINRHHIEVMDGNYQDGDEVLGHIVSYACNAMMLWEQLKNNK